MSTDKPPSVEENAKSKGTPLVVWLLVAICVLAIGASFLPGLSTKYGLRAKLSVGVSLGSELQRLIQEARERGVTDMTCNAERCNVSARATELRGIVTAVTSDRTGVITVEYRDAALPVNQRHLVFWPMIEGKDADLSNPAHRSKPVTWQCGRRPETTIPEDLLPVSCK